MELNSDVVNGFTVKDELKNDLIKLLNAGMTLNAVKLLYDASPSDCKVHLREAKEYCDYLKRGLKLF